MKQYLAFDVGGTFIKYGVINNDATIVRSSKKPTPNSMRDLLDLISDVCKENDSCEGLAISAPGAVSPSGMIYGSSAIPYLHKENVKQLVEERTGMKVYIENDANCAGYAEIWDGAAKGEKDILVVVIGTSIGGSIIKNGVIHKGANLHGGDFGYMLMNKDFTSEYDIWSRVASTKALIRNVAQMKKINPTILTGEKIYEWADAGDSDCQKGLDQFHHYLAVGIYNLQYMYDPAVILIGGGISQQQELTKQIDDKLDKLLEIIQLAKIRPTIRTCTFKEHSNLLGAVYAYKQSTIQ